MLKTFRRHQTPCKRAEWDQGYTRCNCPIVIRGTLNQKRITQAVSKFLPEPHCRDMMAAMELARLWEQTGSVIVPPPPAHAVPEPEAKDDDGRIRIEAAVNAYIKDAKDRNNKEGTLEKKENLFARRWKKNAKDHEKVPSTAPSLLRFCDHKGIRFLNQLDLAMIQEWRSTWDCTSLVRHKRQSSVIGFYWFCERAGWLPRNYAHDLTLGLGKIRVDAPETGYFTPPQYQTLLDTTYLYSDRPSVDKHNGPLTVGGHRIRAVMELMRWTGLRVGDAATLERRRLVFDGALWSVIVRQRKTGDPVFCPIPPHVAELLNTVPASQKGNTNERYFFWTGHGKPKTLVANWQRSFGKLFAMAALKEYGDKLLRCHPHMFRDTFAVESILHGVDIKVVSVILGHKSVQTTEDHYMPWVRARQRGLNEQVERSWESQGIVPKVRSIRKKA